MSLQIKSLNAGELTATSDANVYTAPDTAAAIVKAIRFVNKSTSPANLTVTFKKFDPATSGFVQPMLPIGVLIPPSGMLVADDELTMSVKDQIVAKVGATMTGGSGIGFIVSGVERDV